MLEERLLYGKQYRKESMTQRTKPIQFLVYCKVERAISLWKAIQKSPILQYQHLDIVPEINYVAFWGHQ